MAQQFVLFETPRLFFREYEVSDAEAAFEIYGDAVVMEFIGPKNVTASVEQQRETTRYYGQELELFQLERLARAPQPR